MPKEKMKLKICILISFAFLNWILAPISIAGPTYIVFNTSQTTDGTAPAVQTNRLYSIDRGLIAAVPSVPGVDGFQYNSISYSSSGGLLFSSNVFGNAGGVRTSTDSLTSYLGGSYSHQLSFGDVTTTEQPKIAAISSRGDRLFVAFNFWTETPSQSLAPWQIFEFADGDFQPMIDLTSAGVPETARIRGLSVFPGEAIYASFTMTFEIDGQTFAPENIYRLDIDDGKWFIDQSLCTLERVCFADSVADFEFAENLANIFTSSFEGTDR